MQLLWSNEPVGPSHGMWPKKHAFNKRVVRLFGRRNGDPFSNRGIHNDHLMAWWSPCTPTGLFGLQGQENAPNRAEMSALMKRLPVPLFFIEVQRPTDVATRWILHSQVAIETKLQRDALTASPSFAEWNILPGSMVKILFTARVSARRKFFQIRFKQQGLKSPASSVWRLVQIQEDDQQTIKRAWLTEYLSIRTKHPPNSNMRTLCKDQASSRLDVNASLVYCG